jgi:hypothetical protein
MAGLAEGGGPGDDTMLIGGDESGSVDVREIADGVFSWGWPARRAWLEEARLGGVHPAGDTTRTGSCREELIEGVKMGFWGL